MQLLVDSAEKGYQLESVNAAVIGGKNVVVVAVVVVVALEGRSRTMRLFT